MFSTPLPQFVHCATPADWTFVLMLGFITIGPIIALCIRISRGKL